MRRDLPQGRKLLLGGLWIVLELKVESTVDSDD